ncbi:hypothetical protein LR48_Vigan03g062600 [Vigna angularis]|uniref:Uncharacterized protein n=1 Tax=Phaseolus angularis TaxID=3914 RepID=A0A0L9U381_PHAAN|nr:hypothetical protein LR48_Vigan03g062600 [Vigna angularis]
MSFIQIPEPLFAYNKHIIWPTRKQQPPRVRNITAATTLHLAIFLECFMELGMIFTVIAGAHTEASLHGQHVGEELEQGAGAAATKVVILGHSTPNCTVQTAAPSEKSAVHLPHTQGKEVKHGDSLELSLLRFLLFV